ncbi:MAG: fibronectin type III domain-containing protein, partial [Gemmatimonadota bacterium]|nr:fibronectin type III domain-containing protein [Gemmatimonadota bacterium]
QWQWQRRRRSTDAWTDITSATNPAYMPMTEDIGSQLRATVRYQAEPNVYPHAQSAATEPVQPGVPSEPQNLRAAAGDESVKLTWQAPAHNGGAEITDYAYRYRTDGGMRWLPSVEGTTVKPTTSHTVRTLTNGTPYTFEVWAVNAAGPGAASSVKATPAGVPAPPAVRAQREDRGAALHIRLVADNGAPITRIERRISHLNGKPVHHRPRWSTIQGRANYRSFFDPGYSVYWGGLTNGTTYTFTLRAHNRQGASADTVVSVTPAGVPKAPVLTAVGGVGQVQLTWTEADSNGAAIARYEVRHRVADSGHGWPAWAEVAGGPTARDTTLTGLLNGTAYKFAVRAVNDVGNGAEASAPATPQPRSFSPWYYRLAASLPETPAPQTGTSVSTPMGWNTTNPGATSQAGVWRTRATRAPNASDWVFLTPQLFESETHATPLPKPTGLAATAVDHDSARLNWNAVSGAGSYQARYRVGDSTDPWSTTTTLHPFLDIFRLSGDTTYEWEVRALADDADEAHSGWADASFTTLTAPTNRGDTEYAYRVSQVAPLFDTGASGTPDHWSFSAITWTDAAPRVWRIERTRPSGGTWSEWGGLEKYSERPAAPLVSFYRRAVNNPGAPLSTTASATPSTWEASNPGATATLNVWQTQRSRPTGDTHYQFTTPVIVAFATGTPPPETQTAYRLHTSGTTAPS